MACEMKTKQTMKEKVDPSREELLDLVLGRASQLSNLLNKPMLAAFGVSLVSEDKDLYDRMHRLTQLRNEIAHRGVKVKEQEAMGLVWSAGQLFEWLNKL